MRTENPDPKNHKRGHFLELTAALEVAVLLERRLVLPQSFDCSALGLFGFAEVGFGMFLEIFGGFCLFLDVLGDFDLFKGCVVFVLS